VQTSLQAFAMLEISIDMHAGYLGQVKGHHSILESCRLFSFARMYVSLSVTCVWRLLSIRSDGTFRGRLPTARLSMCTLMSIRLMGSNSFDGRRSLGS
jgi:hypothetical protein